MNISGMPMTMALLLSERTDAGWRRGAGGARGQPRHQLLEHRAVFEPSEAGVAGREPIERQHLLHRIGVAEEHHDFLQVGTGHARLPLLCDAVAASLPATKARA